MRTRVITSALVALAALISVASSTPAPRAEASGAVTDHAVFNDPRARGGHPGRIVDELVALVKGTPPGETIHVVNYHFSDKKLATALIEADRKRVTVRVLVDGNEPLEGTQYVRVRKAFEHSPRSSITPCLQKNAPKSNSSCLGTHINHNKFYLFSKTSGSDHVVVQATANLNSASGTRMWNSAVVLSGDRVNGGGKRLYDAYLDYYDNLLSMRQQLDYYEKHPAKPIGNLAVYHSPRWAGNTGLAVLKNVRCSGNSSGGTSDGQHRTIIRISQWQIGATWGKKIAHRLAQLDNQGCFVDIVASDISLKKKSGDKDQALEELLKRPTGKFHGPIVREFSKYYEHNGDVHEKNMMIDGWYGKPNQKVVFTGSFNFNDTSTDANDETWLKISDRKIHDQFVANFQQVRHCANLDWQTSSRQRKPPSHASCRA